MRSCSVQDSNIGSAMLRGAETIALALAASCAGVAADGPPLESLYGAYEVIGRGAGGETYRGWVRLAIEAGEIEVDRCIDGRHTSGSGREVWRGPDRMRAIEFRYEQHLTAIVATCTVSGDFDNLPRFSCYTTPQASPAIAVPGIEAAFPIVWPVPRDFFDCR